MAPFTVLCLSGSHLFQYTGFYGVEEHHRDNVECHQGAFQFGARVGVYCSHPAPSFRQPLYQAVTECL